LLARVKQMQRDGEELMSFSPPAPLC